jgi:hypothetical protein
LTTPLAFSTASRTGSGALGAAGVGAAAAG